jgi:hypothetical protein
MTTSTNQLQPIIKRGMRETRARNQKTIGRHLGIAPGEWRKFYLFIRRTIYQGDDLSDFDQ